MKSGAPLLFEAAHQANGVEWSYAPLRVSNQEKAVGETSTEGYMEFSLAIAVAMLHSAL